ncbi:hypothetical protein ACF8EA_08190 [Pseudomonas sp. YQ_5]|uniref:hypothetical protein n=1 Tax=Pseudomonas sp. YQ_5 TaxID=3367229 RepID=UPI00370A16A6
MPTENRSSNTEMVSFPRELSDELAELIATRARVCGGGAFDIWEAICEGFAAPSPQPHPEPIAWMVGTAFWWTKEEAERDAAATGLPIVGLGPMTGAAPAEQHQGEPVAWRGLNELGEVVTDWIDGFPPSSMVDLCGNPASFASIELAYTHTAPGEVERLRTMLDQTDADLRSVTADRDTLRAETDRLRQEVASIDKKLRGNVSDPDPLKPIMPGALSITTTYGLVAGIVRERDQLKKALERQPS